MKIAVRMHGGVFHIIHKECDVMSTINNDYSNLFSSIGFGSTSSGNKSSSIDSFYGDYASIKNGSYGKLLKAYYKKQENAARAEEADENKGTYSKLKGYSSSLSDAADALTSSSLYQKGSFQVTKSDGSKEDSDYDYDTLYDKVSSFVDSYNSTLKAGSAFDSGSISTRTLSLASLTSKNSNVLSSVGISISLDGELSVNEDKFKTANINSIKTLFAGSGSYANSVANKADVISSLAAKQLNTYSSYDSKGSYDNSSVSNIYNNYT